MEIKIKKIRKNARLPKRGSEFAAGADLYACLDEPIMLPPGETAFIPIGISAEIPEGYAGFVFARSGLASKEGLAPANKVGVVDSDFRGEMMAALHNHSDQPQTIEPGDRVLQLVIAPCVQAVFEEAEELTDTARGEGGWGSTGR